MSSSASLTELHHTIRARLGSAVAHTRLLSVGAPFVDEIIRLIEGDLLDALQALRAIDEIEDDLGRLLGFSDSRRAV